MFNPKWVSRFFISKVYPWGQAMAIFGHSNLPASHLPRHPPKGVKFQRWLRGRNFRPLEDSGIHTRNYYRFLVELLTSFHQSIFYTSTRFISPTGSQKIQLWAGAGASLIELSHQLLELKLNKLEYYNYWSSLKEMADKFMAHFHNILVYHGLSWYSH